MSPLSLVLQTSTLLNALTAHCGSLYVSVYKNKRTKFYANLYKMSQLPPPQFPFILEIRSVERRICPIAESTMTVDCAVTPLVYSRCQGLPGRRCLHLERGLQADVTSVPSLTVFRQRLKTVLFSRSYPNICVI